MSIPFIGVLTLVRKDLLVRLIRSIDYPVDQVSILFQGTRVDMAGLSNPFVKKISFISCDMNVGVSRGWNYLITHHDAPYWLITGDDNQFEAGTLAKVASFMDETALTNVMCGLSLRRSGTVIPAGFNAFILTRKILDRVGLFDENIYPAYYEDSDLWHRIVMMNEKTVTIPDTFILSGDATFNGSCTIQSVSPEYREKMTVCSTRNGQYYHDKWNIKGVHYKYPFNDPTQDIKQPRIHENYYLNQEILLGHRKRPVFRTL